MKPVSGKLTAADIATIVELYKNNWTMSALGRRFGVARMTISYQLQQAGVKSRSRPLLDENREFNATGVIISVREQASGEIRDLHEAGHRMDAARVITERIDRMPGDWRVICYSTPDTIIGDLRGDTQTRKRHWKLERQMLGSLGRADLLDPEIA